MKRSDITEKKLEADGWSFDRQVTCSHYLPAGTISQMKPVCGYQLVRIHMGKTVGKRHWQLTEVYKKPLAEKTEA